MILYEVKGASSLNSFTALGGVRQLVSLKKFHDNLRVLLETKKGTQIGDPEFGCNLIELLYEPANEVTASLIRQEVTRAIENYYTNMQILQVDVTFKKCSIVLLITYRLVNTNINDSVELEFVTTK